MARKTPLEELLKKRETLDALIQQEKAKQRSRNRKLDNRRKILAGAAVLYNAEHDPVFKKTVMKMIDGFLARDDERAVFELPPKSNDLSSAQ